MALGEERAYGVVPIPWGHPTLSEQGNGICGRNLLPSRFTRTKMGTTESE